MRYLILLAACILYGCNALNTPEPKMYTSDLLNPKKWHTDHGKENVKYTENELRLHVRDGQISEIRSRFTFKYGRVGAWIKLPEEQGVWSAFWLYPTNDLPEYDIMEHCGGQRFVSVTHHWGYNYDNSGEFKNQTEWNKKRLKDPLGWNYYEVEITPEIARYYINGKVVRKTRHVGSGENQIIFSCKFGEYCDSGSEAEGRLLVKELKLVKYK